MKIEQLLIRTIVVVSLVAVAWLPHTFAQRRTADHHPNVIIVMTDDQGYGDLGAHGNPVIRTPHLDRLHSQSDRFTDFKVID